MAQTAMATFQLVLAGLAAAEPIDGYFRYPAIHEETIVFTAEGDLWRADLGGGSATRLTSHEAEETHATISHDGRMVAYAANYDGTVEVHVVPLAGGVPVKVTHEGGLARPRGWTPDGRILYSTRFYSKLPDTRLAVIAPDGTGREAIPLSQAIDGSYLDPETLVFTRYGQPSHTKGYRGGRAQSLWKYRDGADSAIHLTADYPGISDDPMVWQQRIYFSSDRDGTMNLWSMDPDGSSLRQHTFHIGFDIDSPAMHSGRAVYQLGADLWVYDARRDRPARLALALQSDFQQRRERWIRNPRDYLTSVHASPDGDRMVATARGRVFSFPAGKGRLTPIAPDPGTRHREARFLDAERIVTIADQSGEMELWQFDARGRDAGTPLTEDHTTLVNRLYPAPDASRIAYLDIDHVLRIVELESRRVRTVVPSPTGRVFDLRWSSDAAYLAFVATEPNSLTTIRIYDVANDTVTAVTSDRFESFSPEFSPDGNWLYFLSNRRLDSRTDSPFGTYQPGPHLDKTTLIYQLALEPHLRSPFDPPDELLKQRAAAAVDQDETHRIDFDLIMTRLYQVPVSAGNYADLQANEGHLYWVDRDRAGSRTGRLRVLPIDAEKTEVKTLVSSIRHYELTNDRKKLLVQTSRRFYMLDATDKPPKNFSDKQISTVGWAFRTAPTVEWRQLYLDAWRMHRDYFYDPNMHGLDWEAMRDKYLPLVERVTDRAELNDVIAQLVSELSALHNNVSGGDLRTTSTKLPLATLGARFQRDTETGGFRIEEIYSGDPDLPHLASPLASPGVALAPGDVITTIDAAALRTVSDPGALLANKAGRQTLIAGVRGDGTPFEHVVEPISAASDAKLRYETWVTERRLRVENLGGGQLGYIHLSGLGAQHYAEWARHYFPVYNRAGLIIDMRHNRGGNIDSWILSSLLRRSWMWWQHQEEAPYSNMQYAFNGHLVVLCDEHTSSDGEAFVEGIKRLGLGTVIGTRTWGGQIWRTNRNRLLDKGIATVPEIGVYAAGEWLIEGHGVEPDIVVDNEPHATFLGRDAQLDAAIEFLLAAIEREPREVPSAPPFRRLR